MDFKPDFEQRQLRDGALRFVRETANFERLRRYAAAGGEPPADAWAQMAALGWTAIGIGEADGGFGGSPFDTMVLMEALGGGFVIEPYVSSCVLAPPMLTDSNSPGAAAVLAAVAQGEAKVALALGEADGGFDLASVSMRAERTGDTFSVSGLKTYVPDGPGATHVIVPVRTAGAVDDPHGLTLLLVDAGSPGLSSAAYRSIDHRPAAQMRFDHVTVPADRVLGDADHGFERLELAVDHAMAAEMAEALGAMEAAAALTLAYLKTRTQFGALIGSFQALQHRMADIAIACEEARSLVYHATSRLGAPRHERRRALSAAKCRVGQCGLFVGHQCVQLHGGIGTSDEMAVSHYMRRLRMLDMRFGNADFHRSLFAAMGNDAA